MAIVVGTMLALAWLLVVAFPGTNYRCALFVAVGSVAAMHLFVQYIFMMFLGQWVTSGPTEEAWGLALKIAFLWPLVVWGAGCCLGQRGQWRKTVIAAIVTAVLSEGTEFIRYAVR